jgi:hypothetical protein
MKPVLDIKPIKLNARSVHRIEAGKGLQVTCLEGVAWITQAKDMRDVILSRGQSFVLDRKGLAVVLALKDATVLVGAPGHVTAAGTDITAMRPQNRAA